VVGWKEDTVMQIIIDIFNLIFLGPVVNLLVVILKGLEFLHIPGALGFAIILLTILIRIAVWPFFASQMRSTQKMNELKPHMDKLKLKHKDDKQAFAQAQMALYKEHGVNPAGGCLPVLIQFPVFIALYQAISAFFEGSHGLERINNILYSSNLNLSSTPDLHFFGVNLITKPSEFTTVGLWLLLIPIITAVLQLLQGRMMMPVPVKNYPTDSPKEKKEKESTEDTMQAVQSQMLYMMPIMVGYFAFQFPIGLALYWNTTTIVSMIQQYLITGVGGLSSWIEILKRKSA
jgi:YidC/Oxa1 family membrane protein insertase